MEHHHHNGHEGHEVHPVEALRFSIMLLAGTLVIEVAGGLLAGSLALLADAGHVFMDLFALTISLGAVLLARRPPTAMRTYGWHRAEILAALINGLLLTGLAFVLFREAWLRIQEPRQVLAMPMLAVAVLGLGINILVAFRLHGSHTPDLNIHSAYLHVLGDTLASAGVVIAAIVIRLTGWYIIDPLMSIVIAVLIVAGALRLMMRAGHVLLESVPFGMSLHSVAEAIRKVEGVNDVHDIHIWTVCSHIISLSCHVNIDWKSAEDHDRVVKAIADMLHRKFCIVHSTIQVDYKNCGNSVVTDDMKHH